MVAVASDHFREKDVRDLQKMDLKGYKLALDKILSPKSVKNYLDHFKTFIRWCAGMKGIRTQITAFLRLPKYDPSPRWIEPTDQINLYEQVEDRDKPFIGFLMLHPVRPGEARAIKIKDVNLRNQIITVCRTWSNNVLCEGRKGPNGSASSYVVPIHPEYLEWITQRLHEALPEAFLFTNPVNGNHYTASAYLKVWDKVRIKAGISKELRLYDATRHSIGTNLSNSGTDLKKLRDMMGHADIRTTLKYTHSNAEHLRIDLNKLSLKRPAEILPIKKGKVNERQR